MNFSQRKTRLNPRPTYKVPEDEDETPLVLLEALDIDIGRTFVPKRSIPPRHQRTCIPHISHALKTDTTSNDAVSQGPQMDEYHSRLRKWFQIRPDASGSGKSVSPTQSRSTSPVPPVHAVEGSMFPPSADESGLPKTGKHYHRISLTECAYPKSITSIGDTVAPTLCPTISSSNHHCRPSALPGAHDLLTAFHNWSSLLKLVNTSDMITQEVAELLSTMLCSLDDLLGSEIYPDVMEILQVCESLCASACQIVY